MTAFRFIILIIIPILTGCIHIKVHKQPNFDKAMAFGGPEECRVYQSEAPSPGGNKSRVPYVAVTATGDSFPDSEFIKRGTKRLREFNPDLIIVQSPQTQRTGTYHSFGLYSGLSTPIYTKTITLWACRYTKARLGMLWDNETHMVTVISNKALYEGGLLEGDTIISIDDAPIPPTHDAMLDWDPGQVVRLIWIRPGTGRMAAEVKLIHNE
jgi:hypothetical protein